MDDDGIAVRKQRVIDSALRLVCDGGVSAASLRSVSAAAEVNIGSVRYYFGTHEGLLIATGDELLGRIRKRVEAHEARRQSGGDPREAVEGMLAELLPLDTVRRDECTALIAFAAHARNNPRFRDLTQRSATGQYTLVHRILTEAGVTEVDAETERLVALLDGITFAAIHGVPDRSPDEIRRLLAFHLDAIGVRRAPKRVRSASG